ncbi:dipeptidyl peptidase IV N-terminal region-domain-containing protein [Cyathus striatus]|nr:dipeptidyl peptidase IV N-terminal region-domain-containing protein [Cyathus striatus]
MRIASSESLPQYDPEETSALAPAPQQPKKSTRSSSSSRPPTYYGEGAFSAPSSDSEDEEGGVVPPRSPGRAEAGGSGAARYASPERKNKPLRALLIILTCLVGASAFIGIIGAYTYVGAGGYRIPGVRKITMDHIFNGTFYVERASLNWVKEAGDGVFSISQDGYIKLVDLKTNTTTDLVKQMDIKDEHGNPISIASWQLSPDMKQILIKTDYKKQWRHSSFGNYYVHTLSTKQTIPIVPPSSPAKTAQCLAFVLDNDLYVIPPGLESAPLRVTDTGNASLFHGVPDWVYEEEVFSADFALWFSPDASKLAFLSSDETKVPEFVFPVVPYTDEVRMKYPKPGYDNPIVQVRVFDLQGYLSANTTASPSPSVSVSTFTHTLTWEPKHLDTDSIIQEVAWVGNGSLVVKEVNRNADDGTKSGDLAGYSRGRVVRKLGKDGEQGDEGWIDSEQSIYALPASLIGKSTFSALASNAYLDVVPNKDGYNHLALFNPADASQPRFLTTGNWEVVGGVKGSMERRRHLYSIALPSSLSSIADAPAEPTPLTDTEKLGYYSSDFSPEAGFYVLNYGGPSIPWQKVEKIDDKKFSYYLTNNERLSNMTAEYEAATVSYETINIDGYELNVKEIRPPRMDDSGGPSILYGGPGSQTVDTRFSRDWHEYVACGLGYIVVTLRNTVKGNLGFWETRDQVEAAKVWAGKEYVDTKRIGFGDGWSYGGFMSSKVVEANAGVHSLAMAVAPVTSWRLYDSIYTERGYVNASISNVTGFHSVDYLLQHGSGDDNVHFANSAHLLDMLTREQVRRFRFRMFVDSDHSIVRRGAQREVYEYMGGFLLEKWGRGGRKVGGM